MESGLDGENQQTRGHVYCYQQFIEDRGGAAMVFGEVSGPAAFVRAVDEGAVGAGGDAAEVVDLGVGEVMDLAEGLEA